MFQLERELASSFRRCARLLREKDSFLLPGTQNQYNIANFIRLNKKKQKIINKLSSILINLCCLWIDFRFLKTHLMHRNELGVLLAAAGNKPAPPQSDGLDLIELYSNFGPEFSFWLNNNDYTACSKPSEVPVFVYNQGRCRKVFFLT